VDERSESVGRKIREAELHKAPYMLVVGDKEAEAGAVAVRRHREGDIGTMPVSEFRDLALEEVADKRPRGG
jgi:threonyl-tRNA synthetase